MKVRLICEPVEPTALWVTDIMDGVIHEAMKKEMNIEAATDGSIDNWQELSNNSCSERCLVLVIGYSSVWINETLTKLCALGVEPVLVSVYQHQFGIEYSYVSFNTVEAMRTLVRYVSETGRRGVALFGMHRDTVGDRAKLSGFVSGMHDAGMDFSREDIFYRGMMSDCADRLLKKIDKYETVMCTSDLIAVYLIRYLESKGIRVPEDINITGFGNWKAAESFHPSITRMYTDLAELGSQAVKHYIYMQNNPQTLHGASVLKSSRQIGGSTEHCPNVWKECCEKTFPFSGNDSPIYNSDPDIIEILKLEPLVRSIDSLDIAILREIDENKSYAQISESINISESTIKYRLSKMQRICDFPDRMQLLKFAKKSGLI